MKTFTEFLNEIRAIVPVVSLTTTGTDTSIPEIKNELNRNIDLELAGEFVTVEQALNKLRKVLSMYSLDLPEFDSDDKKSDTVTLTVGHHHIVYDEFDGKVKESNPQELKFTYKLDNGLYKCSAELL